MYLALTQCKISRAFLHNFKSAIFRSKIGLFENFKSLYSLESLFWHDCVIFFSWFRILKGWYWPLKWHIHTRKKLHYDKSRFVDKRLLRSNPWREKTPIIFNFRGVSFLVFCLCQIFHGYFCVTLEVNITP